MRGKGEVWRAAPDGRRWRSRRVWLDWPGDKPAHWERVRRLCVRRGIPISLVRTEADCQAVLHGCWFDAAAAADAVEFIESFCVHCDGEWAGAPLVLDWWEREEIVWPLFGWMRPDGTRRFRKAYIEIPRRNGKSTLSAALALLLLIGDGEPGAQVVSAAGDRDQAREVFGAARKMVLNGLLSDSVTVYQNSMAVPQTGSRFQVLSSEAYTKHGKNLSAVLADELHVWPDRELWDVLLSGTGSRRQPLALAITTAGWDRNSICWELHEQARRVIDGLDLDDSVFGYISAAEEGDTWWRLETWIRANPGLGLDGWIEDVPDAEATYPREVRLSGACPFRPSATEATAYLDELQGWCRANPGYGASPKLDYLVDEARAAVHSPGKQNAFRRLHVNVWTQQESRFLDLRQWDKCARSVDWGATHGRPAYLGLDLSQRLDLSAAALVVPPADWLAAGAAWGELDTEEARKARKKAEQKQRARRGADLPPALDTRGLAVDPATVPGEWYIKVWCWLPGEDLEARCRHDRMRYDALAEAGHLRLIPGAVIDQDAILEFLETDVLPVWDIRQVGYDSWNADMMAFRLRAQGVATREVPQTFMYMNTALREAVALLTSGKLVHDGDPLLRWNADNLVVEVDNNGSMRPSKKKSRQKIDGFVAALIALHRALHWGGLVRARRAGSRVSFAG